MLQLVALLNRYLPAQLFSLFYAMVGNGIGVNSGPMHICAALGLIPKSLVEIMRNHVTCFGLLIDYSNRESD